MSFKNCILSWNPFEMYNVTYETVRYFLYNHTGMFITNIMFMSTCIYEKTIQQTC